MLLALVIMVSNEIDYDQSMVTKAKSKLIYIWGSTTSPKERKSTLLAIAKELANAKKQVNNSCTLCT